MQTIKQRLNYRFSMNNNAWKFFQFDQFKSFRIWKWKTIEPYECEFSVFPFHTKAIFFWSFSDTKLYSYTLNVMRMKSNRAKQIFCSVQVLGISSSSGLVISFLCNLLKTSISLNQVEFFVFNMFCPPVFSGEK